MFETLQLLFGPRGAPTFIRSDNVPECVANEVKRFLAEEGVGALFIEPGSPWENAYIESFNSRPRDELLDRELFEGLTEAKVVVEDHRLDYNHHRAHSSLGHWTPASCAASCGRAAPVGAAPLPTPPGRTKDHAPTLITSGA